MRRTGVRFILLFVLVAVLGSCCGPCVLVNSGHPGVFELLLLVATLAFLALSLSSIFDSIRTAANAKIQGYASIADTTFDLRAAVVQNAARSLAQQGRPTTAPPKPAVGQHVASAKSAIFASFGHNYDR